MNLSSEDRLKKRNICCFLSRFFWNGIYLLKFIFGVPNDNPLSS